MLLTAPARAVQMVFRTQFLLTGPGLQPWHSDAHFIAGMTRYLQVGGSGVGNLTLNGWLPFNATQTPVRRTGLPSCPDRRRVVGSAVAMVQQKQRWVERCPRRPSACHMPGLRNSSAAERLQFAFNHTAVAGAYPCKIRAVIHRGHVRQDVLALVTVPPAELAQAIWVGMSGSTLVRARLRPALRRFWHVEFSSWRLSDQSQYKCGELEDCHAGR